MCSQKRHPFLTIIFTSLLYYGATLYADEPSLSIGEIDHLTLEDLSQLKIEENAATLTYTIARQTPATVTVITHEQIAASGARTLDELLDIYVPSFAYLYKVHGSQLGIRGITSDRNNKILLLVNGHKMNINGTDGGAVTERWFSTLGDIRRISIINGPGSAIYGAGAIAGVISIETFDGNTFEGFDAEIKGGGGTHFEALQMRYGTKIFDENAALFLYCGVEDADGADDAHAPHKLAFDLINRPWSPRTAVFIAANKNMPFPSTNNGAVFEDALKHKLHIQLDGEDYTLWARYTKSGQAVPA